MSKRFALVGTGGRAGSFLQPLATTYRDHAELVGLCDNSATRLRHWSRTLQDKHGSSPVTTYDAADFDRMIAEQKPDTVIVTTPDYLHDEYIVRALDLGCDVVTEKPMTIDETRCRRILDAVARTGRRLRVTFNYRWMDVNTRVYELLREGLIGTVRHVSVQYALDTSHGADYFRRWHSEKDKSGGLQIHKSTHHLDLLNWWLDAIPEKIYAQGGLHFYGRENALARGDEALTRYERYTGTDSGDDPFRLDLNSNDNLRQLYHEAEADSGYLRDRNVFREGISIEDSFDILLSYRNGLQATYTLQAFLPFEGWRVTFAGDRGTLQLDEFGGSHLIKGQSDEELAAEQAANPGVRRLTLFPHFQPPVELEFPESTGAHGGGDPRIARQIFDPEAAADPLGRDAGHEQGAASILIGVAANHSLERDTPVRLSELVDLRPEATRFSDLV